MVAYIIEVKRTTKVRANKLDSLRTICGRFCNDITEDGICICRQSFQLWKVPIKLRYHILQLLIEAHSHVIVFLVATMVAKDVRGPL